MKAKVKSEHKSKTTFKLEGFFTWPKLIIFAILLGVWTALMAIYVPDGNSFHDIAVTMEWWILPAILIILSCKMAALPRPSQIIYSPQSIASL